MPTDLPDKTGISYAYKASLIEEVVVRLMIRVPTIVLANLVLGENVMPELLQRQANPDQLAAAVVSLLSDTPERDRQMRAFARLDAIMRIGDATPSEKAADIVIDLAHKGRSVLFSASLKLAPLDTAH